MITPGPKGQLTGRNHSTVADGENGLTITKNLRGEDWDVARRLHNSLTWERLAPLVDAVPSPALVSHGPNSLTHAYVLGSQSLQERLDEVELPEQAGEDLCSAARVLAALHTFPLDRAVAVFGAEQVRPPEGQRGLLERFDGLTVEEYAVSSGGELSCWRLFHHDSVLRDALASWMTAPPGHSTLIHGDLRPDQFLFDDDVCWLIDWEEFTIGSPMRDLGGLLGALVFRAMLETFSAPANGGDLAQIHQALVTDGEARLDEVRPVAQAVIDAYTEAGGTVDDDDLARWSSWYLVERVVARSMLAVDLSPVDKAVAGVGRQGVLEPSLMLDVLKAA